MSTLLLTGAGPASGAFAPPSISGLVGWWKADAAGTTVDGTAIATWTDQSTAGHNLTQATGSKQPLYKASILNSLPVLRFDGVDDFIKGSWTQAQPVHIFIVGKFNNSSLTGLPAMYDGASLNVMRMSRATSTTVSLYDGGAGGTDIVTTTPESFHIYSALHSGASSELRVDGGTAATGNPGTASPGGLTVGTLGDGGTGSVAAVDVAEILVFNRALTSTERQQIEVYLQTRYATP